MTPRPEILKAGILIVDDRAANLLLLEQMLRNAGYEAITTTRNPAEVCGLHRANHYDLILLDLQMPGMDGFQVMAQLQAMETDNQVPVLVVTAQPEHRRRALQAGAKDFVSKPFDLVEVLLRVHNLLEVRILHRCENVQNLARLQNAQRIASLGNWEHDLVTDRLLWSDEFFRILGLSQAGVPPSEAAFFRLVHPDDLATVRQARQAATVQGGRFDYEHRIIRPDGMERQVHQVGEIEFNDAGTPIRESGTMQDITARKHAESALRDSEERFRFVARAVSDAVWDWNLGSGELWWNDGFLKTFGYAAGEIAPSTAAKAERIHPDERQDVNESLQHAIASPKEVWSAAYRFRRKDGSFASVEDRGFIVRGADGRAVRMVGGMRDLTAQKNLEAQLVRAQRLESIGTLAGGIAHDLNNVLAPIMMAIEMLQRDPANSPARCRTLAALDISCRQGTDLVRQILSFGRGLDGRQVPVQLQDLINDLKLVIEETFPRNIRVVDEVPKDLWTVAGDPSQLHQVLLNLAVNARDAMPHGGTLTFAGANIVIDDQYAGTSRESVAARSPQFRAGRHVLLEVTDTGAGIPPEVLERIFEPFFTTKEIGRGTGLGLATVHTVVKSHGGFVNVYSEVGSGTTFKVYLPGDMAPRKPVTAKAPPATLPLGRNELILVVDDEPSIREITQQTLEAFGYRVITARDGAEAIALYAQQAVRIDVILTDIMMPIMDGAATIQVLLRLNPAVKIIATSGLRISENLDKASRAGVKHFLPKPYTAETLLVLLHNVLEPVKEAVPVERVPVA